MFKRIITGTVIFGMAALAPPPAAAESFCTARGEIVRQLENAFAESLRGAGMQSPRDIVELWVSRETGSWTVLTTQADGTSCIRASGMYWQDYDTAPQASRVPVRATRE